MSQWNEVMQQLGGGSMPTPYDNEFFHWWQWQIIVINDYPYEGIDYQGDCDMSFPPGSAFGEIDENWFLYISFFCVFQFDK
jgi:hypothetical protein